jgi:hypothetical protein
MRTENLYIGTIEEITEMVTRNHVELEGIPLNQQIETIQQRVGRMGLIFMKKGKGCGRFSIDKWFVFIVDNIKN